ncbi:MAG: ABC transporter ATP-binding protein/permease [Treponemataceae bacterium]|nr:ABC transporter ATP-binding protein/permease [Treponemataceae bacterium]
MKKDFSARPIKVFLSYFLPHKKLFALDLLCATFIAAIDVSFPMLSRWAIDSVIPEKNFRAFFTLIFAILAAYIFRKLCSYCVTYWGHVFGNLVEADMRRDIFAQIERQSFSFFDKNRTGALMSRVTNDLFDITELAHHGPEDVWTSLLTLFGSCFLLFKIRMELAIIVFAFLPIAIALVIFSRKSLMRSSKKVKETTAEINSAIESSISGIRATQAFTNEKFEQEKFDSGNANFVRAKQWRYKAMATFQSNIEFANNILYLVVLAAGGFFIMRGKMKVSDLIAANLFVAAFTAPIGKLSFFTELFTTGMAGFSRFLEIMRTDTSIKEADDAVEIIGARGNIRFENVGFSYNENFPVLKNVNLEIRAGEKQALVGTSGGGKTTICNLIPRFYEASEGRILLDGIDIKKLKVENLRKQIGIVQQEVFLFAGTIRENIAYGKVGASLDEIVKAAKRAEIHDDIMKMPQGYDTIVGERGITLSGGQKQRVSIARCFLKNPPILILDEATSALDSATELKIQGAFDALSKGRTTIVIAHRLSTIRNADNIAVIGEHGITESGTHDALIAKGGEYKRLCESQFARK